MSARDALRFQGHRAAAAPPSAKLNPAKPISFVHLLHIALASVHGDLKKLKKDYLY